MAGTQERAQPESLTGQEARPEQAFEGVGGEEMQAV